MLLGRKPTTNKLNTGYVMVGDARCAVTLHNGNLLPLRVQCTPGGGSSTVGDGELLPQTSQTNDMKLILVAS